MAIFVFVYLYIRVLLYIRMFPGDLVVFLGDFNPTDSVALVQKAVNQQFTVHNEFFTGYHLSNKYPTHSAQTWPYPVTSSCRDSQINMSNLKSSSVDGSASLRANRHFTNHNYVGEG